MAKALVMRSPEYVLFVLGFALGAYSAGLTKYAAVLSAILSVLEGVLNSYCVFLQLGLLAGVFVRMTKQ